MKLDLSDGQSNHSDYSSDSQSSQSSSNHDFSNASPAFRRSVLTLANLEGLNSGVPTRTTATLTPTHLRNIEQTFIELQCRNEHNSHAGAGFVPPPIATHANNYGILNPTAYHEMGPGVLHVSPGPLSTSGDSSSSPGLPAPKRRNMGGRRPTKTPTDISPEEEERRKVRRERNKMAAARCRKRRLDHTNELQDETDDLERKKKQLQEEIQQLNQTKMQLQCILENHLSTCRKQRQPSPPDVKPFPVIPPDDVRVKVEVMEPVDPVMGFESDMLDTPITEKRIMLSAANPQVVTSLHQSQSLNTPPVKPNRPNFLSVPFSINPAQVHGIKNGSEIPGIDITTPSTGIPFNFESLMEGGTGLTPVQPCANQHKTHPEIISPETALNNKLVSL